jgi:hypothetical protein
VKWSAIWVGAVSGVADAVLRHLMSEVVPQYGASTVLVISVFAVLVLVSSHVDEVHWAHKLLGNWKADMIWLLVSLLVAWAVNSLMEFGAAFVRALSTATL